MVGEIPVWIVFTVLIGLPLAYIIGIATGYRLGKLTQENKDSNY